MGVIISELRCFYNIYQGLIRYSGATKSFIAGGIGGGTRNRTRVRHLSQI